MRIYNSSKEIIDRNNPCKFNGNVCAAGRVNGCCGECSMHAKDKGCIAISLFCKLYLCDTAKGNMPKEDLDKLNALILEADKLLIYDDKFRNSSFSRLLK